MQSRTHLRRHSNTRRPATAWLAPWLSAFKLLVAFSLVFFNAAMQANPVGPVVTQGAATFDAAGNRLTVTNTPGTVINWQTFNIPAGNTTHFSQQGADSSVLNRVVTNDPSKIFGTLSSNGRVILVNQAGIVVGAGAVVDTAGFIASTLNMSEADRLLNKGKFTGNGTNSSIQIDGMLRSTNGDIVLIAPQINVGTQALVKADNGVVTLAAGQQVMLTGRGLEGITLELQAPSDKVVNLGRLEGDAVGIFASQLKHSGAIQARTAYLEGGRVVLKAVDTATVDGQVDASGTGQAGSGGRVTVEGSAVALQGASIASTGTKQGGHVLVGGGWQGKDAAVSNSQATTVDAKSRINVSGQGTGNAGTAVVWSDGNTRYAGKIDARGGAQSGNGGQVEVSGKAQLAFSGGVLVSASAGMPGSLLLDPKNIVINSTGSVITGSGLGFASNGSTTFTVDASSLQSVLAGLGGGTLTLAATNDVTLNNSVALAGSYNGTLNIEAGRSVDLQGTVLSSGLPFVLRVTANSSAPGAGSATTPWRDAGQGGITQTGAINVGTNGAVVFTVGNGVGGGGTITVGDITAGKIVLDNTGTGGGIARTGLTLLTAADSVVLKAQSGTVGISGNGININAPKFSVKSGGNAALTVTGPGSLTRLAPATELGGVAADVGGTLDISTAGFMRVGAAGTETAPVTVSAGTLTLRAGSLTFATTSTNTAVLNVTVTGLAQITATSAGVTFGGSSSVAPVNFNAGALTVAGADIQVAGAPFGSTGAYTSIAVSNTATFNSTSAAPGSIAVSGGGGIGNDVLFEAGALTLKATGGGIQLTGGSASNTGVTVRANTGNLALDAAGSGLSVTGGNAGFSGITATAAVGTVTLTSAGDITVIGGPGPVGGPAVIYGNSAVVGSTYSGDVLVTGDGASATVASNTASGSGVSLSTSLGKIAVQGGNQTNAFAKVAGRQVVLSDASSTNDVFIEGGSANQAYALVQGGTGGVLINSGAHVHVSGSSNAATTGAYAGISSVGNTTITAPSGSVLVAGGLGTQSSASIDVTGGTLNITASIALGVNAGDGSFAFARISGSGDTRVVANSVNVVAAGPSAPADIRSTGGSLYVEALTPSQINVSGGTGGAGSFAQLAASSGTVTVKAPQGLKVEAGTSAGSDGLVQGANVVLDLGLGPLYVYGSASPLGTSSAYISSSGNTSVTAGTIVVNAQAGIGSRAEIFSGGTVTLAGSSLSVQGGSSDLGRAAVTGLNRVDINTLGVFVTGGGGSTATASINSGAGGLTVTSPSISVNGGGGTNSFAGLRSSGTVAIFGDVSLSGGFGAGAQAGISTSGVISTITGSVTFTAGGGADADAVIFASNGAALAAAKSLGTVTTATLAGSATSQVGVIVPPSVASNPGVLPFFPSSAVPGSGGQFTVTVANLGPNSDTLTLVVTGLPNGSQTVNVGVLAPGATTTVVVSFPISPTATGTANPILSVSGTLPDTSTANNTVNSFFTLTPQVNFGVSVPSTALTLGTTNTIPVTVNNTGPSAGNGTVTISLPGGGTFAFAVSLLPGASSTSLAQFFVPNDMAYVVAASVVTLQPDLVPGNNSSSQSLFIPPPVPEPTPEPTPVVPPVTTPTNTVTLPTPTATLPVPTTTSPTPTPTVPTPTPTVPTPTPTLPTPTPTVPTPTPTVPTPTPTLPTPTVTLPTPTPIQPPVVVVPPPPPVTPPLAPPPTTNSNDPSPTRQNESFPGQFARLVGLNIDRGSANDDIVITDTQCRPQ